MIRIFTNVKKTSAYLGLTLILLFTCAFGFQMKSLKFSDNFDAFFPEGDKALDYYLSLTKEFGVYNDFVFIALEGDDVFSSKFLTKIDSLTKRLESLEKSITVISPTNFKRYQVTPFGINSFNVINPSQGIDETLVKSESQLYGQFFGKNDQSVGIILRHPDFKNKQRADEFYSLLLNTLNKSGFPNPIISGKIQAQHDFSLRLKSEVGLLLGTAILLIMVMLALVFKTLRGVIAPLITLIITLIWIFGFFGLTGRPIDVLAIMIPPILLVVSMSDVIHLCDKFNECVHQGMKVREAIKESIKLVGMATMLTSLTTAIGFFSLAVSPIAPIKNFGLYTGIGVIFAFLVTFTTIPCLLALINKPLNKKTSRRISWSNLLDNIHSWSINHRNPILVISFIVFLLGGMATLKVKKNTFLIVGVDKNDPLMQSMIYFDKNFDGNKPFEMTYELASEHELFSEGTIKKLNAIHNYLEDQYGISHIESPLSLIKTINQSIHGGASSAYELPKTSDYSRIERIYESRQFADLKSKLHSKNGVTLRINGRGKDIGSAAAAVKNEALRSSFSKELNLSDNQYQITGTSHMIDKTDNYITSSIISGLAIAIAAVAFLMLIITRSVKIMLISILPNIIPLIILSGIMGVFGIDLNIATAVIFSIAFGIAVDDSIHFIIRHHLECKHNSNAIAIQRTFLSTGKSIILTTAVLFVGFIVFLFSGFSATYYIGLFVATTLIVALIADLTLLPALLSFKRK
ncbi:MAG: hydrophobe/amphiphile efflux-3 (HAE3) family protein [Roseivirga sp.]